MNTQTQEALKMAITQFERIDKEYDCTEIIDICKEALEQPTQEPVAFNGEEYEFVGVMPADKGDINMFYKTHPAPSWQGLSDDERDKIYFKTFDMWSSQVDIDYAEAIEQALKEKNDKG